MSQEKSRVEKIVDQINSKNAKKIAILLVFAFACYHGVLHIKYGTDSCSWLLTNGRYKGNKEWQPYGCMLHLYTNIDTRKCLRYIAFYDKNTHFVFMGDSRMREKYKAFVQQLEIRENVENNRFLERNLSHVDNTLKVRVEFIWEPFISKSLIEYLRNSNLLEKPPSVIIIGNALSTIQNTNGSSAGLQEYTLNLTRLVQPLDRLKAKKTKVLWALQEPVNEDKLKNSIINNNIINKYNRAAVDVLSYSGAYLWWSARLIGEGLLNSSPDGIHMAPKGLKHQAQILYNMYCNDYMNYNDGTCCSSNEPYTTIQIVTFALFGICIITSVVLILHRSVQKCRGRPVHEYGALSDGELSTPKVLTPISCYTLFTSLSKMAIIMSYFFVCDRTNFFMKENKYYSEYSLWIPIAYVTVLGLFFTEDSKFTKILHRDQLVEWKGWMILVILVYYMTGATKVPINMFIKVLVSTFLFLIGYEHFCLIWQRSETSVVSFFRTMFQLNFITVVLCLCMNRPYQFYYFVPLMSFCFVVVYSFLSFPPVVSAQNSENNHAQYFYLLIKFIGLFVIITVLFLSEVFFEKIFVTRPWKALFVTTDDDIHDWWRQWKIDRYSVIFGMSFGLILVLAQKYSLFDDNNHSNLFSRGLSLSATLLAIIGIGSYITMTFLCRNELECTEIHSYVSFIPIVSYVILRNISGVLRTRYSTFFAWFGHISLELFISQYHIWLAADTHGVLVLLPGFPVLNVMLTSYIFVCASHEVHNLTKILLPYAVPQDLKLALRNFILFLALLVPIGINDGMF